MTEIDRVFYTIEHSTTYPGWVAVRLKGSQSPTGWAQSIPEAVADLNHWLTQRDRWRK